MKNRSLSDLVNSFWVELLGIHNGRRWRVFRGIVKDVQAALYHRCQKIMKDLGFLNHHSTLLSVVQYSPLIYVDEDLDFGG